MDFLFILIDIVIAGFGVYAFYCGIILKTKNIVTKSILVSKDMEFKKCRDIEGYKNYMVKRILIDSAIIVLFGALTVINDFLEFSDFMHKINFIPMLGAIIWFMIFSKRGQQRYFE